MNESIVSINVNYGNGGSPHTASITTVKDVVTPQGLEESLGDVFAEVGRKSTFSNERIQYLMRNFVCTKESTNKGPVKENCVREYVDNTSLILKSRVLLVKGINAPIDGKNPKPDDPAKPVPYFTECPNTPLRFNYLNQTGAPTEIGSAICVGKVYNYETAARWDGLKMNLIWYQRELDGNLSLNEEFADTNYLQNPDLSQVDLKFGYTIKEFIQACGMINIALSGLEQVKDSEKIIFDVSGTFDAVISSIASALGLYWYINPEDGVVQFVSSQSAATMTIKNWTEETEDESIINASYSKSALSETLVNTYVGTTEKQGESEKNPKDDDRPISVFFKRINFEKPIERFITHQELGAFFRLFNQKSLYTDNIFNKYTMAVVSLFENFDLGRAAKWGDDELALYPYKPMGALHGGGGGKDGRIFPFTKGGWGANDGIFVKGTLDHKDWSTGKNKSKYKGIPDRTFCQYFRLLYMDDDGASQVMPFPTDCPVAAFMKCYFEACGGIYISNGYGKYRALRMAFDNMNNINVVGPFHKDTEITKIKELSPLVDLLKKVGYIDKTLEKVTVEKLREWVVTNDPKRKIVSVNDYHFLAFRAFPQLEANERKKEDPPVIDVFGTHIEFLQPDKLGNLYLGGPIRMDQRGGADGGGPFKKQMVGIVEESQAAYDAALEMRTLGLKYRRSKTEVNKLPEDDEEEKDNEIARSSEADNALADLMDRYDLKKFEVDSMPASIYRPITLNSEQGSTTEIEALRDAKASMGIPQVDQPLENSSRTVYGLDIPEFKATTSSVSIDLGASGITTTISESTLKLIPPDREFLLMKGMQSVGNSRQAQFNAAQRNMFGLTR